MIRLTLLLILALAAQVHAQSGKLIVSDSPQPATVEGYEKGHCVALRDRIRICKVLSESDALFIVQSEGKTIGSWPADSELGYTEDFEVMHGDLDGDRKPELIVANHDTTSNGLGIDVWSISIFRDDNFRGFQPPLVFSVQEYGTHGTFVSTNGRLNILQTDWVSGDDPKGRRQGGLYLVGQWWRYEHGELQPLPKRIMARRYLFSFERERGRSESDRTPYEWLANRHTEFVSTGFITGVGNVGNHGVIESVVTNGKDSRYRIKVMFKSDSGQTSEFNYVNDDGLDVDRYIGEAASNRVYPDRYLPSDPETWLTGRSATLRTYGKTQILWLDRTK